MEVEKHLYVLLGFEHFFANETPKTREFYLSDLNCEEVERFCCKYLAQFESNAIPNFGEKMITEYEYNIFTDSEVIHKLATYFSLNLSKKCTIFSVESLLNLLVYVGRNKINITPNIHSENKSINLFKLLLLFNNDYLKKLGLANASIKDLDLTKRLQGQILVYSFSQSDFNNIDYKKLFYTQLFKAIELLNFIEENEKYKKLFVKLLEELNFKNKQDYINAISATITSFLIIDNRIKYEQILVLKNDTNYEKNKQFLDYLSVNFNNDFEEQNDFKELRGCPLKDIGNGQYLIIFKLFLVKKIYNGLIFGLSEIYDKLPKLEPLKNPNFLGKIRNDFSEEILTYNCLKDILSAPNSDSVTGKEFKAKKIKGGVEPDYYYAEQNGNVLLFECKDFFIDGNTKSSYIFSDIEYKLKKSKDKKGNEKEDRLGKAVKQLAKNIERVILKKDLDLRQNYKDENLKIFPIIIVHDSLYSCPALNYWVHHWLLDEINLLKKDEKFKNFDFSRIIPLTIIEIDSIIYYKEALKKISLIEFIKNYHQEVELEKNSFINKSEIEEHATRSSNSFALFINNYFKNYNDLQFDLNVIESLFG